jgi:hypothetical protein
LLVGVSWRRVCVFKLLPLSNAFQTSCKVLEHVLLRVMISYPFSRTHPHSFRIFKNFVPICLMVLLPMSNAHQLRTCGSGETIISYQFETATSALIEYYQVKHGTITRLTVIRCMLLRTPSTWPMRQSQGVVRRPGLPHPPLLALHRWQRSVGTDAHYLRNERRGPSGKPN